MIPSAAPSTSNYARDTISVGVELPLAGLVFIAAQAALAYGTSGFLKVPEKIEIQPSLY